MSDKMPKRITLGRISMGEGEPLILDVRDIHLPPEYQVEYVRADIHDALRAEVERLREALTEIERIYLTECDADWRAAQMSAYATIELMDSAARATSPACQSGSATETTCEDEG